MKWETNLLSEAKKILQTGGEVRLLVLKRGLTGRKIQIFVSTQVLSEDIEVEEED